MVENQRQDETVAIDDISFSEGCSLASGKHTYFSGNCSFVFPFCSDWKRNTKKREPYDT